MEMLRNENVTKKKKKNTNYNETTKDISKPLLLFLIGFGILCFAIFYKIFDIIVTVGLLFLTNDGELANMLTHPSHKVEKKYLAKIDGIINLKDIYMLENGIVLDGIKTKKAKAKIQKIDKKNKKSFVELTITEGRNHQVKNMFGALGYKVLKLKRTNYDFLTLKNLSIGQSRKLTIKEIKKLYNNAKEKSF